MYRCKIHEQKEMIESLEQQVARLEATIKTHCDMRHDIALYKRRLARAEQRRVEAEQKRQADHGHLYTYVTDLEHELRRYRDVDAQKAYAKSTTASRARQAFGATTQRPSWESKARVAQTSSAGEESSTPWSRRPDPDAPLPSFMRSTVASRARTADLSTAHPRLDKYDVLEEPCKTPESVYGGRGGEPTYLGSGMDPIDRYYAKKRISFFAIPKDGRWPDNEWHLMLEARLGKGYVLTQWADQSWLKGGAGAVRLRSRFVKDILHDALELAAEIWYAWCRVNRPEFVAKYAPEGPWDLLLDRQTLIYRGVGIYPSGHLSGNHFEGFPGAQTLTHLVYNCFGGGLRNTYCHFDSEDSWPASVYALVYPVLEFAKAVDDEPRAQKAMLLLEKLGTEATETYAEIGRMVWLSALPESRPWEHHHAELFDTVLAELGHHVDSSLSAKEPWRRSADSRAWGRPTYGRAVLRAALEYRQRGRLVRQRCGLGSDWKGTAYNPSEALGYSWGSWSQGNVALYYELSPEYIPPAPSWRQSERRTRRISVCGADIEGMHKTHDAPKDSRWKCRRDPRLALNWLDLALKF